MCLSLQQVQKKRESGNSEQVKGDQLEKATEKMGEGGVKYTGGGR